LTWPRGRLTIREIAEALAAYDRAVILDPRDPALHFDLAGNTLRFLHRFADAIEANERALALAPDLPYARLNNARIDVLWRGDLDAPRQVVSRGPETYGYAVSWDLWRARLALWQRQPDSVQAVLQATEYVTFESQDSYEPTSLYAAWAHQLRGDHVAARDPFTSALAQLDAALRGRPDDWRLHASRGLALAALGRQAEATREADWLTRSIAWLSSYTQTELSEARAVIFAQADLADEALAELEPLLGGPSWTSAHLIRLDPRWDPIRDDSRFQTLLVRYGSPPEAGERPVRVTAARGADAPSTRRP
jgi:tetratricopeptide (TPR) repeat protein